MAVQPGRRERRERGVRFSTAHPELQAQLLPAGYVAARVATWNEAWGKRVSARQGWAGEMVPFSAAVIASGLPPNKPPEDPARSASSCPPNQPSHTPARRWFRNRFRRDQASRQSSHRAARSHSNRAAAVLWSAPPTHSRRSEEHTSEL